MKPSKLASALTFLKNIKLIQPEALICTQVERQDLSMLGQLMKTTTEAVAHVATLMYHITNFKSRSFNRQIHDDVKNFRIAI